MPPRLRVATFNLHAGIDGWGRDSGALDLAVALDADVLFLQEAWRGEAVDQAQWIASSLGATAHVVPLAHGFLRSEGSGTRRWQPRAALLSGRHGIVLDEERPVREAMRRALRDDPTTDEGEWCIAIVTKLPVASVESVELLHLPKDRARRRLLVAQCVLDGRALWCATLHGAHLSHGSLRQYRELHDDLDRLAPAPAVLGGDLNAWGFVARRVLPEWRHAVRGATWPSWRAHSQLDHLFVRGALTVLDGGVVDATNSDHRPVAATLELAD